MYVLIHINLKLDEDKRKKKAGFHLFFLFFLYTKVRHKYHGQILKNIHIVCTINPSKHQNPPPQKTSPTFPCVVNLPLCVNPPILPNINSTCLYAALGAYCGTICPLRLTSTHVNPRSVWVVPNTPAPATVPRLAST